MEFEWDRQKDLQNIQKHGVRFADACLIFEGFTLDAPEKRLDYGEERYISIGMAGGVVVLAVVHTDRRGVRRIISARQANKEERGRYEETLRKGLDA